MGLQACAGEGGWVRVKQWVKEKDQLEYMVTPESLFTFPSLVPRCRGEGGSGLASPYPTCVPNFWCCVFQVVQEKHAIIQRGVKTNRSMFLPQPIDQMFLCRLVCN